MPRRFIAVSDSHGDMIDPESEKAVLAFIADFKPTVRIHMGDAFDFRCLRKGASDEEKNDGLNSDWEAGSEFLRKFYKGGSENMYLHGNHDLPRLERLRGSTNAALRGFAEIGIQNFKSLLQRCRVKTVLPYDSRLGVLRLGHLKFIHGYAAGLNAGTKHARAYGNVCYGHVHTVEVHAVDTDDGPREARGVGALCRIDMDYNAHQLGKLRHGNGFAYGLLHDNGDYTIFQAIKVNGRFHAAHDVRSY